MNKKVVVIGGGTGSVAVLSGLKKYEDLDISVIVSMTDDGGSNRVVRDEFGLLPLSDLRKSIIALAGAGNGMFRKLFTYRFDRGDGLSGHTLGNLIMMALSDVTGSEQGAIDAACKIFDVRGKIIPVTYNLVKLTAEYDDGDIVKGEHIIDEPEQHLNSKIKRLSVTPNAQANPEAISAIREADFLIIGPGDLYTSTLANFVIDGIPEAVAECSAKIIFINNLMTKKGQTHWMKASDVVKEVARYANNRFPDIVIQNQSEIPDQILEKYRQSGETPVEDDLEINQYQVIHENVIFDQEIARDNGDTLVRSFIRHDPEKLAMILYNIFTNY